MYRVYTEDPIARINLGIRRRLAPLLRSRRKVELMTALLFSLPGTPVLYYGDEIGMGDNVYLGDRDGVRTPMQWSGDRNGGFSRANPQKLYLPVIIDPEYHYEAVNVEAQEANPASLLWWTKRLIALRKQHPALGRGEIEFLSPENPRVLAFVRSDGTERVLVVANLSRYPQHAELDLARFAGTTPVEVLGRNQFPTVTDRPFPLALGPHDFYWFVLEEAQANAAKTRPTLRTTTAWTDVFEARTELARALTAYAVGRRWFRGKARRIRASEVLDVIELAAGGVATRFVVFEIAYSDHDPETYLVPVAFAAGESATGIEQRSPHAIIAYIEGPAPGVIYDSLATGEGASALLTSLRAGATVMSELGRLESTPNEALRDVCGDCDLAPRPVRFEQTNSTVPFGDKLVLKVFRQLEPGTNAEIEVGSFLTAHAPRGVTPRVVGSVHYHRPGAEPTAVAVAHEFLPNQGIAWDLYETHLDTLFDRVLSGHIEAPPTPEEHLYDLVGRDAPPEFVELAGAHLRHARRLGQRIAEVHVLLASGTEPGFAPEPFTQMHQQSLFQGVRTLLVRTSETLQRKRASLPESVRADVDLFLSSRPAVEARLREITARIIDTTRVRSHGDLHLGQVLWTGDDFVLIDFEGEPGRPLSDRRRKRSPLRDLAGMIQSFSYAVESDLYAGRQRPQDVTRLRPWARAWMAWTGAACLTGYLETPGVRPLIPAKPEDTRLLLDFYRLEKVVYEVNYELNNRPDWLPIPMRGLRDIVGVAIGASP